MDEDKPKRAVARKLTDLDRDIVERVRRAGFVGVDAKGECYLETSEDIDFYRVRRLVALGVLEPGDDALIGDRPQTYRLTPPKEAATSET